jgi:hypothetical protein
VISPLAPSQHSVVSCFATYLLPHLLFLDDFAARQKIAAACRLAWNISLLSDAAERTEHIDSAWKMTARGDSGLSPPAGVELGFKRKLHDLIAQKQELFPRVLAKISKAELKRANGHDVLMAGMHDDCEPVPLVAHPHPSGLPHFIEVLKGLCRDTAEQATVLETALSTPGALGDAVRVRLELAYAKQRADLIGYRQILSRWSLDQPGPSVRRVIGYWLGVLDDIEGSTKATLGLLRGEAVSRPTRGID